MHHDDYGILHSEFMSKKFAIYAAIRALSIICGKDDLYALTLNSPPIDEKELHAQILAALERVC